MPSLPYGKDRCDMGVSANLTQIVQQHAPVREGTAIVHAAAAGAPGVAAARDWGGKRRMHWAVCVPHGGAPRSITGRAALRMQQEPPSSRSLALRHGACLVAGGKPISE